MFCDKFIDEMDGCIRDIAKLIDSTANALFITTYCRLTGRNRTHITQCLGNNFFHCLLLTNYVNLIFLFRILCLKMIFNLFKNFDLLHSFSLISFFGSVL